MQNEQIISSVIITLLALTGIGFYLATRLPKVTKSILDSKNVIRMNDLNSTVEESKVA
jgi:hypothetical protein